jgi:hypothetical protein
MPLLLDYLSPRVFFHYILAYLRFYYVNSELYQYNEFFFKGKMCIVYIDRWYAHYDKRANESEKFYVSNFNYSQ